MYSENVVNQLKNKFDEIEDWLVKVRNNDPTLAVDFSNYVGENNFDTIHINKIFRASSLEELINQANKQAEILELKDLINREALAIIEQGKEVSPEILNRIKMEVSQCQFVKASIYNEEEYETEM